MSDSPTKPFKRLWEYATVVYFVGCLIALYVYTSGDWGWDMPPRLPVAAIALVPVSFGLLAVYTGEVSIKFTVYRSKNPIIYWFGVAMSLFFGISMFLLGIGVGT